MWEAVHESHMANLSYNGVKAQLQSWSKLDPKRKRKERRLVAGLSLVMWKGWSTLQESGVGVRRVRVEVRIL